MSTRTKKRMVRNERVRIVWMWLDGMSVKETAHLTGASVSTVYRWIRRWREEGTVESKKYHGGRHSTSWKEMMSVTTMNQTPKLNVYHPLLMYPNPKAVDHNIQESAFHKLTNLYNQLCNQYDERQKLGHYSVLLRRIMRQKTVFDMKGYFSHNQ